MSNKAYGTQLHPRVNDESMKVLKYAMHNTRLKSYGEVIDEALAVWRLALDGTFDEAIESIEREARLKKEKVLNLKEKVDEGTVVVPPLVQIAPLVPAIPAQPDVNPYAKYSREDLLARCPDTEPSAIMDWARSWKQELFDVGWMPGDFVKAKTEMTKGQPMTVKADAPAAQTATSSAQLRIDSLVRRLHNIALGDKSSANFTVEFERVRALDLSGDRLDEFKATVVKKFKSKVQPDILAKRAKTESVEVALAVFEDNWFREFEVDEEQKEALRVTT